MKHTMRSPTKTVKTFSSYARTSAPWMKDIEHILLNTAPSRRIPSLDDSSLAVPVRIVASRNSPVKYSSDDYLHVPVSIVRSTSSTPVKSMAGNQIQLMPASYPIQVPVTLSDSNCTPVTLSDSKWRQDPRIDVPVSISNNYPWPVQWMRETTAMQVPVSVASTTPVTLMDDYPIQLPVTLSNSMYGPVKWIQDSHIERPVAVSNKPAQPVQWMQEATMRVPVTSNQITSKSVPWNENIEIKVPVTVSNSNSTPVKWMQDPRIDVPVSILRTFFNNYPWPVQWMQDTTMHVPVSVASTTSVTLMGDYPIRMPVALSNYMSGPVKWTRESQIEVPVVISNKAVQPVQWMQEPTIQVPVKVTALDSSELIMDQLLHIPVTISTPTPTTLADALNESRQARVITNITPPYAIVGVNNAWCSLCGFSESEAVGQSLAILRAKETDAEKIQYLLKSIPSILTDSRVSMTLTNIKKDGTPINTKLTVTPLRNDKGDITNLLGILENLDNLNVEQM